MIGGDDLYDVVRRVEPQAVLVEVDSARIVLTLVVHADDSLHTEAALGVVDRNECSVAERFLGVSL